MFLYRRKNKEFDGNPSRNGWLYVGALLASNSAEVLVVARAILKERKSGGEKS